MIRRYTARGALLGALGGVIMIAVLMKDVDALHPFTDQVMRFYFIPIYFMGFLFGRGAAGATGCFYSRLSGWS